MSKKTTALIYCLALALGALWLGGKQQIIGGPMIGLLMSMLLVNALNMEEEFKKQALAVGKKLLDFGIILAGGTLHFSQILGFGSKALGLLLLNLVLAFLVASYFGRRLGLSDNTAKLVGGGTAICGGTAIATLATIFKAKEEEIAYALTAIFLFDVLAALGYPYLAKALGMSANQFGFLAGSAINDTSSVAAAQETFNVLMGIEATQPITVKMTRIMLLIPTSLFFAFRQLGSGEKDQDGLLKTVQRIFPWAILWFMLMALFNSLGFFSFIGIPGKVFSLSYKYFITAALVGIGLKIRFKDLLTQGAKPILLGGITWLSLALSSLIFIFVFRNFIG
ncbi:MAG: putative sulfate exporter family transporter [Tissierellia bacterium]|nr:putative sulfate exporter family transporter [Tissierellia bacterium]